ncbi:MAG: dockerin type I repeat-containing protein [Clostridia bacterium]|nr:dockerin type I repeat-containing protein [Clostridia bacterium]
MKLCKRIIAAVLMAAMLAVCVPALGVPDYPEVPEGYDGYVTFSVSTIMLGWHYLVDPILVPVNEGDTVAVVTDRALTMACVGFSYSGTIEEGFYLSAIECYDKTPDVPDYLMHEMVDVYPDWAEENLGFAYGEWTGNYVDDDMLSAGEYSTFSGWMYTENNVDPGVGADSCVVTIGASYMWFFSIYGWGMDYGISDGWGMFPEFDNPMAGVSRDAAAIALAQMEADESITDEMIENAMDEFEALLMAFYYPTATQQELDDALAAFIAAVYGTGEYELGDVNMDGEINSADALMILRSVMGLVELEDEALADYNGDGSVTSEDALLVLRLALQ